MSRHARRQILIELYKQHNEELAKKDAADKTHKKKGDKGEKGEKGEKGDKGDKGDKDLKV